MEAEAKDFFTLKDGSYMKRFHIKNGSFKIKFPFEFLRMNHTIFIGRIPGSLLLFNCSKVDDVVFKALRDIFSVPKSKEFPLISTQFTGPSSLLRWWFCLLLIEISLSLLNMCVSSG